MSDGLSFRPVQRPASRRTHTPSAVTLIRGPHWRDGLRTVLVTVVGLGLCFLPAAGIVVGDISRSFLGFAAGLTAQWFVCVSVQYAALSIIRHRAPSQSLALTVLIIALIGVSAHFLMPINPLGVPLGLDARDGWQGVVGAWTAVPIAGYLVWEGEARAHHAASSRRLFEVQQARLRLRRSVVESQLRAMQARIDSRFLFWILDAVERNYAHDAPRAEALFDELVAYLRAVLPHADQGTSSLARELDLASTVMRIDNLARDIGSRLTIGVGAEVVSRPFPAGVLLPLVHGVLEAAALRAASRPCDIALTAAATDSTLTRLRMETSVAPGPQTQADVRDSLRALYGDAASLKCKVQEGGTIVLTVEVPHDG